jgi:hypothetical protein
VFLGTGVLALSTRGFAAVNAVLVLILLALAWDVGRTYRRLTTAAREEAHHG